MSTWLCGANHCQKLLVYRDVRKWTLIYNVNLNVIGSNPNLVLVGQRLRIPCLVENAANTIRFLTADDYAPFTDRKLIKNGLVTDMLATSLRLNPDKPAFIVSWVNDWSKRLDPLLTRHEYDRGFPWLRPDGESTPDDYRCQNFEFSNPIFRVLVLLFVDRSRPLAFNTDVDIDGVVLCRPNGYYTHDLEKDGRAYG